MTDSALKLQIVILAAGKGVRMNSALPKVLHSVCGQTLIERSLRAVKELSPERVVFVVGYEAEKVRTEIESLSAQGVIEAGKLHFALQAEQHGTGHAAKLALPALTAGLVLIMPGDCPLMRKEVLQQLVHEHQARAAAITILSFEPEDGAGFGRILRGPDGKVQEIIESKDCNEQQRGIREVNSSVYLVEHQLLSEALMALKNHNAQQEYYLTDIVGFAVKRGANVQALNIGKDSAALGANDRAELSALETIRRAEINRRWQIAGVTLEDPNQTYIDEAVELSEDCFVGAGVRLRGKTKIGTNVVIDGNSLIVDSEIHPRAHIKFSCVINKAIVGAGAEVGPFAHLRPETVLHEDVKIGNFVEVKKSELEKGAKANHLTYLGDTFVGERANIGAGTITCNYDGVAKYRTTIEEGAFIGSNSSLVAPVRVGAGAVIGAGSTITKDVPAGSLGISRERQENVEGWTQKRKKKES